MVLTTPALSQMKLYLEAAKYFTLNHSALLFIYGMNVFFLFFFLFIFQNQAGILSDFLFNSNTNKMCVKMFNHFKNIIFRIYNIRKITDLVKMQTNYIFARVFFLYSSSFFVIFLFLYLVYDDDDDDDIVSELVCIHVRM